MKAKKLKEVIDFYINNGHENDDVVITLSEPSIGCRAFSDIRYVASGFDFEHGQIRIEPEKSLLSKTKDRDAPMKPWAKTYDYGNRKQTIIHCPICENKLRKADKYCSKCGQMISEELRSNKWINVKRT